MGVDRTSRGNDPAEGTSQQAAPTPPELHSEQDMLAWKREHNIRQREADWKRRQEEMLMHKQVAWEIERCERENRFTGAKENRRREELEARVLHRHTDVERKYKDMCRDVEIQRLEKAWQEKENARLVAMHEEAKRQRNDREQRLAEEKELHFEGFRTAASERAAKKKAQEELNRKREENIRRKELERQQRAAENAKQLKSDAIAKSQAAVDAFVAKTVSSEPTFVSTLATRSINPQQGNSGASDTTICREEIQTH